MAPRESLEKKRDRAAKERIAATRKAHDFGPSLRVRFQNLEDEQAPLTFNVEGRNFGPLIPGKEYELPSGVVGHLNSLTIPIYGLEKDENTGQMVSRPVGRRNRFNCIPVDFAQFAKGRSIPKEETALQGGITT